MENSLSLFGDVGPTNEKLNGHKYRFYRANTSINKIDVQNWYFGDYFKSMSDYKNKLRPFKMPEKK